MIEYRCPLCGAFVSVEILACMPPITRYRCQVCSYRYEERDAIETIVAPLPKDEEEKE